MNSNSLPFLFRIASDPWLLLICFIILIIILHLILVWWKQLSKTAWKKVDYIWLGIAALALLPGATEAHRFFASVEENQLKPRAEFNYNLIRVYAQGAQGWTCREFVRSELSPPNLDQIIKEYNAVCDYYKALLQALPKEPPANLDPIDILAKVKRPPVTTRELVDAFTNIDQAATDYNAMVQRYKELTKSKEKSDAEDMLIVIGPLLLALALALRITKVTGEIRLEKANADIKAVDNSENLNKTPH